jgi:PAS domain S-box-containing protein
VDGQVRWILAESVPRDLADGSTVWEGVISDITEQVQAEQDLRRMLSVLPIPVACTQLEKPQPIVFLNQRFLDTFGYGADELPSVEVWAELAYPDPGYRQQVMDGWALEVQRGQAGAVEMGPMELEVTCKDGSLRSVILTASIRDNLIVATFLDVTERKRAEAALERAFRREADLKERQRLELEAKLRTSLTAAAVAHEIKQPLSAILLHSRLLQQQAGAVARRPGAQPAPAPPRAAAGRERADRDHDREDAHAAAQRADRSSSASISAM